MKSFNANDVQFQYCSSNSLQPELSTVYDYLRFLLLKLNENETAIKNKPTIIKYRKQEVSTTCLDLPFLHLLFQTDTNSDHLLSLSNNDLCKCINLNMVISQQLKDLKFSSH